MPERRRGENGRRGRAEGARRDTGERKWDGNDEKEPQEHQNGTEITKRPPKNVKVEAQEQQNETREDQNELLGSSKVVHDGSRWHQEAARRRPKPNRMTQNGVHRDGWMGQGEERRSQREQTKGGDKKDEEGVGLAEVPSLGALATRSF